MKEFSAQETGARLIETIRIEAHPCRVESASPGNVIHLAIMSVILFRIILRRLIVGTLDSIQDH